MSAALILCDLGTYATVSAAVLYVRSACDCRRKTARTNPQTSLRYTTMESRRKTAEANPQTSLRYTSRTGLEYQPVKGRRAHRHPRRQAACPWAPRRRPDVRRGAHPDEPEPSEVVRTSAPIGHWHLNPVTRRT